jgi:hypothetical protein
MARDQNNFLIRHIRRQAEILKHRISRRALFLIALLIFGFSKALLVQAQVLPNGVNPSNLGKGDWIWVMSEAESRLGVTNTQAIIDYEKGLGMQWIAVKCGDGTNAPPVYWTQFNSTLVTQAHASGLKIFGWAYAYGYNSNYVSGEINTALEALSLGADGFIVDAETEYESSSNNAALAAQYCQGIRAAYPGAFFSYTTAAEISLHPGFPYSVFGYYADAAMPQAYWVDLQLSPATMLSSIDTQWAAWQNGLTGTNRNAIKPLVPVAETDSPGETENDILSFVSGLKADTNSGSIVGYNGVSFWDCQERDAGMDLGVAAATIGQIPVSVVAPQFQSIGMTVEGTIRLALTGRMGSVYEIDKSTNLVNWSALIVFTNATGSYQFTDVSALTNSRGYYRARLLSQ